MEEEAKICPECGGTLIFDHADSDVDLDQRYEIFVCDTCGWEEYTG